jgi:hypothetical protein
MEVHYRTVTVELFETIVCSHTLLIKPTSVRVMPACISLILTSWTFCTIYIPQCVLHDPIVPSFCINCACNSHWRLKITHPMLSISLHSPILILMCPQLFAWQPLFRTPSIKHKFLNQFVSCLNIPDGHVLAHSKPRVSSRFTARGHSLYSGLVYGPHEKK